MKIKTSLAVLTMLCAFNHAKAQTGNSDALYNSFVTPPANTAPRVWWHWMNGNISKDGVEKDLKWMKRVGIAGFQNFDAAWSTPQIVKKRLVFMTPEWKDAFYRATKLADSLQLEMAIAGSPGWSETGGPWVKPQNGMKKVVWSETRVKGGKSFAGTLPKPPSNTGEFQNIGSGEHGGGAHYYKDIAVMAYKLPENDLQFSTLNPKITSSAGSFTIAQLTDGDFAATKKLPMDTASKTAWIQFAFAKPQTFRSLSIAGGERDQTTNAEDNVPKTRSLLVSDDGVTFKMICYVPASTAARQTISFPATTAKFFRVQFTSTHLPKAKDVDIAELEFYTTTRVNRVEEKAAFSVANHLYVPAAPLNAEAASLKDIVDLTGKVDADGKLNWTPPAGNWNIMRFGYSLLGITNHPASPEATGLEVDKMDPIAVKAYFDDYLALYKDATQGLMGNKGGLKYMVMDSWEAGSANWTGNLPAEFKKRRGYDILPWLPVLTGYIVKSAEASDHFLWDFRKTLGELVAEHHYDQATELLHSRGMKRYTESHEAGRALQADGMEIKRTADVPMSAMWTPSTWSGASENYMTDIMESASVAHIYGQNIVAAESMTAYGNPWSWTPEKLKPTADLELACGLNRFVIHTSAHQPLDDKMPGLGLGPFGQWFNRHETWAEQASPWLTYLSRSSHILQQGKFVADVVYYYGEDNNIASIFRYHLPNIPEGYKYDFINADALINLLSVKNKELVTPSGMQYKLLALDSNSRYMTLKVLKKIKLLVDEGAVVVGPKPLVSPSLADDKAEFDQIVNSLWDSNNAGSLGDTKKVFAGIDIDKALQTINIKPDFDYKKPDESSKIYFVHRNTADKEIYWINNHTDKAQTIDGIFRVSGRAVQLWQPETGKQTPASYQIADGTTKVQLQLRPNDAVFVIFSGNTNVAQVNIPEPVQQELSELKGSWNLAFQKDRGAPASVAIDGLSSWTASKDEGVKYFSGTAVYTKTIDVPSKWLKNKAQIFVDLGAVKDIAEVIVNGKSAGTVWNNPFKLEVTGLLKPGKNTVQVKVTNTWVNRLIGDEQPANKHRYTYTTEQFYQATSPLLTSGLLGPVKLISSK